MCFISQRKNQSLKGIFKLCDSNMAIYMCTCSPPITNDIFKSTNANDEFGIWKNHHRQKFSPTNNKQ